MEKIAILTDSACDLTEDIIKKYNIKLAPFRIIYKDKEYEDKITITSDEVYANLVNEIPTTSLPANDRIDKILQDLVAEVYTHVIAINISSNLSGTPNSIRLLLDNYPNLTSHVFDTKTLSLAEGVIVLEAAKMLEKGASFDEIVNTLPSLRKKSHLFFTLNTLVYLKKGGRIGKVAGTVGEILKLKPIITVTDEGVYETYSKTRGRKQSIAKLYEILDNYLEQGKCNVWIVEGDAKEDCSIMYNKLKDDPRINKLDTITLSPALGVHTGPGLIGFAIYEV